MDSVHEEWREVKGYEGYYEVSSQGRVRSVARSVVRVDGKVMHYRSKVLSQTQDRKGENRYLATTLHADNVASRFYVHRLVAEAFIGPCEKGMEVNHKDGAKFNNTPDNLEYVTRQQNADHAIATGLSDNTGENNSQAKHTAAMIRHGYSLVAAGKTYREAAEICGVTRTMLEKVCRGEQWVSLGLAPIAREPLPRRHRTILRELLVRNANGVWFVRTSGDKLAIAPRHLWPDFENCINLPSTLET